MISKKRKNSPSKEALAAALQAYKDKWTLSRIRAVYGVWRSALYVYMEDCEERLRRCPPRGPAPKRLCTWCGETLPKGSRRILCGQEDCAAEYKEWKRREHMKIRGAKAYPKRAAAAAAEAEAPADKKKKSERRAAEVAELAAQGLSVRRIAKKLGIGEGAARYRLDYARGRRPGGERKLSTKA